MVVFCYSLRKKTVEKFVKDNKDDISRFLEEYTWDKALRESDMISFKPSLDPMTSKVLSNILSQDNAQKEEPIFMLML